MAWAGEQSPNSYYKTAQEVVKIVFGQLGKGCARRGPRPAVDIRAWTGDVRRMSREYPERPIIGVGGVVVQEGRVLLVRRGRAPLEGEWSIPGGALEVGETLHDGLRREMLEETGLEVQPTEVLEVLDRIIHDEERRVRYHYVLVDYLCTLVRGPACAASDAAECRWARPAELSGYHLRPETLRVLEKALELVSRQ